MSDPQELASSPTDRHARRQGFITAADQWNSQQQSEVVFDDEVPPYEDHRGLDYGNGQDNSELRDASIPRFLTVVPNVMYLLYSASEPVCEPSDDASSKPFRPSNTHPHPPRSVWRTGRRTPFACTTL